MRSRLRISEVEYLEVYRYATDAATNLEWIDTLIDEVMEELSPRTLLPVGGVPDTRFADSVVTARPPAGSVQDTRGCRVEPWCQQFPASLRRGAVATASASVTRRSRR
jgi:hypothetical protein